MPVRRRFSRPARFSASFQSRPDAVHVLVIFQRLNERSAYAGTGIGLALTRKIIEYFGGRIWLDPTCTEGARFLFTLPMPEETLAPDAIEGPGSARALQDPQAARLIEARAPLDPDHPEDPEDEDPDG